MTHSPNRTTAAIERPDQQRARPMVGDRPAGVGRQDGSSLHARRRAACLAHPEIDNEKVDAARKGKALR